MDAIPKSAEEGLFLAKVAEQSERYEDILSFLKPVIAKTEELTQEERNLFSIAYKNLSGNKRTAWRSLNVIQDNPKYAKFQEKTKNYKKKVEDELKKICMELIATVDSSLFKKATTAEAKAYYLKLKGDYYRYISEVVSGTELDDVSAKAKENYSQAQEAAKDMEPTHPIRLGLALNLSVFTFEILKKPKDACALAKKAFDEAVEGLQKLEEGEYKESSSIMQLLKDNLTLWESEAEEGDDAAAKKPE